MGRFGIALAILFLLGSFLLLMFVAPKFLALICAIAAAACFCPQLRHVASGTTEAEASSRLLINILAGPLAGVLFALAAVGLLLWSEAISGWQTRRNYARAYPLQQAIEEQMPLVEFGQLVEAAAGDPRIRDDLESLSQGFRYDMICNNHGECAKQYFRILVEKGYGSSPLLRAAVNEGHLDMVRLILEAGIDPNAPIPYPSNSPSDTPLLLAARLCETARSEREWAEQSIETCRSNPHLAGALDEELKTLEAKKTAESESSEIFRLLLQYGAVSVEPDDWTYQRVLKRLIPSSNTAAP